MSLKSCPECGKEISSEAKICPNCGKKQESKRVNILANKKAIVGICIVAVAIIIVSTSLFGNSLKKAIYTDVMPGMAWEKVESMFSGENYNIKTSGKFDEAELKKYSYGGYIDVTPRRSLREFLYFGYPVETLEVRFDKNYNVDLVGGEVDLSDRSDMKSIRDDVYEQLAKIGTCIYKYSDGTKYRGDEFIFRINNTPYDIRVYIYENQNDRNRQYMEIIVFSADSGFFGT